MAKYKSVVIMARMRKGRRNREEPFLKGGKKDLVIGKKEIGLTVFNSFRQAFEIKKTSKVKTQKTKRS